MERKSKQPALDRPFDKRILARARQIASQYKIVLEHIEGEWYGHGLEYPEAMGDGKTRKAAIADTRRALVAGVATMLELGQQPPRATQHSGLSTQH
ncbi:MAG TPA: hypothetical protein VGP72_25125 [Planctomycetota bacterium]|jgi:predicted RNase H-like HicB family nuclease